MLYKRPMFKMGGSPTGIATLTPRVNAKIGFPGFEFLEPGLQQEIRSQMKPPTSGATTFSGKGLTRGSTGTRLGLKFLRNFPKTATTGLMSIPFIPTAAMAYANRPKTIEALKFMRGEPGELSPQESFTFDETNLDVGDFYK